MMPIKGMRVLCQYKLGQFSCEEIMMALETYTHHVYKGLLRENPFHPGQLSSR